MGRATVYRMNEALARRPTLALVLLQHFFWQIIVLTVVAVGLYILWENL